MKKLLPFFIACILALQAFAQCPSPVVENWFYNEAENAFVVQVSSESEAEAYYVHVFRQYQDFGFVGNVTMFVDTVIITGTSQTLTIPVASLASGASTLPQNWYYAADISTSCASGETSAFTPFYISALSLLNDPGFSCNGNFFIPRIYLADGSGFAYDIYLSVPASTPAQAIDSLELFVDVGHTYLGDLSITLVSPQGSEIEVLDWPNGLGSSNNMSVLFKDGAPTINDLPSGFNGLSGVASPSESLSTFEGQIAEGVWILRIRDNLALDYGFIYGICMSINGSPCNATVLGSVYYDLNSNGTFDGIDQTLPFPGLINTAENDFFNGNSNGQYADCSVTGASSIALQNTPNNYTSIPSPFTISQDETIPGIDIPITPIPGIFDLCLDWYTNNPVRPGFSATYTATVTNTGTECISGASLNFSFPETASVDSSNPAGAIIGSSTGSFDLPELCPLQQLAYTITFTLDDTVTLGTLFNSSASVTMNQTDAHPANNLSEHLAVVVAAYDPNDKQVSHATVSNWFVQNNEPLKYTVRFQNTGNYAAERVLVVDTLDVNLDLSTFQFISTSHNMELTFNGHIAYFEFDQIFLPDSTTDFEGSIGYLRYSIEPMANFGDGMEIENTAYIFFDFNAPIVTNTVVTGYNAALSVNDFSITSRVFPNPTSDQIRIDWQSTAPISRIAIYDMQGKRMSEVVVGAGIQSTTIDVRKLSQGIYFLEIGGDQGSRTEKFAVVR